MFVEIILSVREELGATPEREDGGRTAYDRFDYQTAWGLTRVLALHKAGKNYAVGFEFHDDIITLDDADSPTKLVFHQVKTKTSGIWSFAQIVQRRKARGKHKPSYAGKMFDNFTKFGASVEKLSFVSNQPLPDVILVHGEEPFSIADRKKLEKFVTGLSEEITGFDADQHTSLFFFCFSELSLTNYEETLLGKIAMFLEGELNASVAPRAFALTVNDYCRKRSKSLADVENFEQLLGSKFVTRDNMMKWLAQTQEAHANPIKWDSVASDLIEMKFSEKKRVERAWRDYETHLLERQNAATAEYIQNMSGAIEEQLDNAESLEHLLALTFPRASKLVLTWRPQSDEQFIKAAVLYESKR